ncbi:MAG: aminopeptidase P family protein [Planctomycetes bacterium]|nr:aminopeptidase P family protein [Planctomycetota bacterium]
MSRSIAGRAGNRRDFLVGAAALCGCTAVRPQVVERTPEQRARDAELFADLRDTDGAPEPISAPERAARRARLAALLPALGLDAFVCEPGPTLTYLTGVAWGRSERLFALSVLADGSSFWICPQFEAPKARLKLAAAGIHDPLLVEWQEHEYAFAPTAAALRERRVERVGFEPQLRLFAADGLAAAHGREHCRMARDVLLATRARKDPHELALMRHASVLTQRAIAAAAQTLEPGVTGAEVAARMRAAQEALGLKDVWVLALIGPAAAFPHGDHDQARLGAGEVVLVDTGGALHGYQSDTTRSWVPFGTPTPEFERAWRTVRTAQQAAFEAIRPGVRCREVDRAARDVITRAGYGDGYSAFAHRLGHGIGLEGHEDPYFDLGSEIELEPGMTLSDEPGIYLYNRFGIRLEDIVVVEAAGADHFGAWPTDMRAPV